MVIKKSVLVSALVIAGCASKPNPRPVTFAELDQFSVDCRYRDQQAAMLLSMRSNYSDRASAQVSNWFRPWTVITDSQGRSNNSIIASGQKNWMIDQHLNQLRNC